MSKIKVISFDLAIKKSVAYKKRHLLLGNGFSIACVPDIFTYRSLFEKANFKTMPQIPKLFDIFQTEDFEYVINALDLSSQTLPAYGNSFKTTANTMKEQAEKLKEILIQTIAENHPAHPNEIKESQYNSCVNFLSHFLNKVNDGKVYSLNYDLLLYWTIMFGMGNKLWTIKPNDGFGRESEYEDGEWKTSGYVTWQGETTAPFQNIHYLHGALHVFDNGSEIEKFTWIDTGVRLIEQTRLALKDNKFPLFVAEGESDKKMDKIIHNGYLYHSYKSFSTVMSQSQLKSSTCLFTYGVSFGKNDSHVFRKITRGKIKKLFVGLYGKPDSASNKAIIDEVEAIKVKRKNVELEVEYYDAESANVWG